MKSSGRMRRDAPRASGIDSSAPALAGQLLRAQEQEHARWARELHDDVTQRLARMAIDLGRFEQTAVSGHPDTALVRDVREQLVCLCRDVHDLSYQLHPATLMDLGLDEALRTECEQLSRRHSVATALTAHNVSGRISGETMVNLFRIAQEAMRNAVQHGRATRIHIDLRGVGKALQLAIRDNGAGFVLSRCRNRSGLGLASMRERARLLRGSLDIISKPGHGTTVIVRVPLRRPTHDQSSPHPARR